MFLGRDAVDSSADTRVSTVEALRHLLVFQLKLAADALRDFLLSPLSVAAFVLDVLIKPSPERSLYLRLMLLGRRSDRMINLFDDYRDAGEFTIDRAVDELESMVTGSGSVDAGINPGKADEGRE